MGIARGGGQGLDGGRLTAAPVAVGLMLPTIANPDTGLVDPARVLEAARVAEDSGFDGVYVGDHLVHPHPLLESVVTLAAVAATTERVSFGPCVMLLALRDPLVIANQLATLAAFGPCRLRVGVGVGGEYPVEFEAAGVPLRERGHRMESVLAEVRVLLEPVAPALPFLFAGWKEVSLRRAAEYGDGWIGYLLGPESFARRRAFLRECRGLLGRSIDDFSIGMLLPIHMDGSRQAATRAAAAWARLVDAPAELPERLFVAGGRSEVIEQLHRYRELGCTEFVLAPAEQGAGFLHQVDQLARHVLPEVKRFS
jgi:alkanesulfonate monooxygenase SsuD/methylene tetrahydromethanopterin reductase-like flavin-dependent oxidoreductase (luciferase family)